MESDSGRSGDGDGGVLKEEKRSDDETHHHHHHKEETIVEEPPIDSTEKSIETRPITSSPKNAK
ncbi:hypothetical protein RYX36_026504, partial [Vicia faba]